MQLQCVVVQVMFIICVLLKQRVDFSPWFAHAAAMYDIEHARSTHYRVKLRLSACRVRPG